MTMKAAVVMPSAPSQMFPPASVANDGVALPTCGSRLGLFQRFRIDHVDRLALGVRKQPVDRAAVDPFVLLLLTVAEVRRADDVRKLEQRMLGADDWLALVHVYRREAGTALLQRLDQCALLDDRRAAGIHEQRRRLHAREIGGGHDTAGFLAPDEMQAQHVDVLEESLAARRHREAFGLRTGGGTLAAPAHHVHAERLTDARHGRPDVPESVDAQRAAVEARA